MTSPLRITAGSRLHFGLLSFGQASGPQYGGAGVMVARPTLIVSFLPAERFEVSGPLPERTRAMVQHVARRLDLAELPAIRVEVESCPPQHSGLGVGTQLGLCLARGVAEMLGRRLDDAVALARTAGRGKRSWVGTYGFLHGGLVYEGGQNLQTPGSPAPLLERVALPKDWRFVLVRRQQASGLSGTTEQDAFASLPPVSSSTTSALRRELEDQLLPAAGDGDLERFGQSVYRYGRMAGECFAARQGGPYAGRKVAELVEWLRAQGVKGVGQSSWGPTVFALVGDETEAQELVEHVRARADSDPLEATIAPPLNSGAVVERVDRTR